MSHAIPRRCLPEVNVEAVRQIVSHVCRDSPCLAQIILVPDQDTPGTTCRMRQMLQLRQLALHLLQPAADVPERLHVGDIVHQDDGIRPAIVGPGQATESLLTLDIITQLL